MDSFGSVIVDQGLLLQKQGARHGSSTCRLRFTVSGYRDGSDTVKDTVNFTAFGATDWNCLRQEKSPLPRWDGLSETA